VGLVLKNYESESIMIKLSYLAAPYSHKEHYMQVARFWAINAVAADYMRRGEYIFSPISHTHPIAEAGELLKDWEYWAEYDSRMISVCNEMLVLTLDGWKESVGVTAEIKIAEGLHIPIWYIEYPYPNFDYLVQKAKNEPDH
jgi:hypothetical protein